MSPFREPPRPRASVFFVFGLALLVLASPARLLWAQSSLPWWAPFLVWLGVIGGGGVVSEWWARGRN